MNLELTFLTVCLIIIAGVFAILFFFYLDKLKSIINNKQRFQAFFLLGLSFVVLVLVQTIFRFRQPYSSLEIISISVMILCCVFVFFIMIRLYRNVDGFFLNEKENTELDVGRGINNILEDNPRWESFCKNLKEEKVFDDDSHFVGLGPNYSKLPTQLGVLIYILNELKIVDAKVDDKKQVNLIGNTFNVKLTPQRYNQIKKTFEDNKGIHKNMKYYHIYEKFKTYL